MLQERWQKDTERGKKTIRKENKRIGRGKYSGKNYGLR